MRVTRPLHCVVWLSKFAELTEEGAYSLIAGDKRTRTGAPGKVGYCKSLSCSDSCTCILCTSRMRAAVQQYLVANILHPLPPDLVEFSCR